MPRVNAADLQRQGAAPTELPRSAGSSAGSEPPTERPAQVASEPATELPTEVAVQAPTEAASEVATEVAPTSEEPRRTTSRAGGVDTARVLELTRTTPPPIDPVRSAMNVEVDREVLRAFEAIVREHRLTKRAVVEQLLRGFVTTQGGTR